MAIYNLLCRENHRPISMRYLSPMSPERLETVITDTPFPAR